MSIYRRLRSLKQQVNQSSPNTSQKRAVVKKRSRAHYARETQLTRIPAFWLMMIASLTVPLIELRAALVGYSSLPTLFSALWLTVELSGAARVFESSPHLIWSRGGVWRLLGAASLWILSDALHLTALAPWIGVKLSLSYLVAWSLKRAHDHQRWISPDPLNRLYRAHILTLMSGLTLSATSLYMWHMGVYPQAHHVTLFILAFGLVMLPHLITSLAALRDMLSFSASSSEGSLIDKLKITEREISDAAERANLLLFFQNFSGTVRRLYVNLALTALHLTACVEALVGRHRLDDSTPLLITSIALFAYTLSDVISLKIVLGFKSLERALMTPWRALSVSMFALCALGTSLLAAPWVKLDGRSLSLMEAAFTSVSASCITGLSVIDLSRLNFSGQLTTLLLIQVGGFGIILITHMILGLRSGEQSLYFSYLTRSMIGDDRSALSYARDLALFVLGVELFSASALTVYFLDRGLSFSEALWQGIFTSISAFCNAGFALHPDSFVSYASHPPVLIIISLTVLVGGIGPRVIREVFDRLSAPKPSRQPLSVYTRVILWANLILVIVPTLLLTWVEWGGALAHLAPSDKLVNALFHTTSLRTAGFNSFDLATLQDSSWSISLVLMLIGGSPFSTAGGVKVTTFVIAITSITSILRGDEHSLLFDRAQGTKNNSKALAILVLSLLVVGLVTLTLQLLGEPLSLRVMLFEVVSAIGTVGLSMGGTGLLSDGGLSLLMMCMFLGRIGPPALLLSFKSSESSNEGQTAESYIEDDLPLS